MKDDEKMPITTLTLNITNSARGQELLTGLLAYIDDMMGLDLDSVSAQLDYVSQYARMRKYEQQGAQMAGLRASL